MTSTTVPTTPWSRLAEPPSRRAAAAPDCDRSAGLVVLADGQIATWGKGVAVKAVAVTRQRIRTRLQSTLILLGVIAGTFGPALVAACAVSPSADAAKGPQKLIIYSIATAQGFVNNEDDRERGKGNNPFGNFKDSTSATKESGNGPFAGDEAMFAFKLFKDPDLKGSIGSATFTCLYNFNKNAFCNVSYQLTGGALIGGGAFNFNANKFALAITGGTGKYRGLTGDLQAFPAANHVQRLAFTLD